MSTQHDIPAGPGAPGPDWWSRRPRRSGTDRKIAGVAGGIGRVFGIDPVLIRVAFVILTVLGGSGILLYVTSWLLLPADGDEVSPVESLLGRGRSATPPIVTVGLAIVALISILSLFSWGLPFLPLVIVGCVLVLLARRKGQGSATCQTPWVDQWSSRAADAGRSWGQQAEQWIANQPWAGAGGSGSRQEQSSEQSRSPFDKPAFWEEPSATGQAQGDPGRINLRKDPRPDPSAGKPDGDEPVAPTPPAWDPLGVAPFAWDLPEPSPADPPPAVRPQRRVIGRITLGMVLLVGGLATVGIVQGWWALTWAGVSALALTVVAVGLLIGSLRGQGRSLIGPGIFLSLLTLALTVTGINGTAAFGQQTWTPTTVAAAEQPFVLNGGQGTLDLRQLDVKVGQTVDAEVTVRAGQATVIVPSDANVDVTCTANAGEVDCLGIRKSGLQQEIRESQTGSSDQGTINLTVHVGAGQGQVRNG